MVLTLASGLIGGAALGCGAVLFFAITSDRLRRRSDVAAALELPVPVSVGRIAPISERWLWVPHVRTLDGRCSHERQRLAHAIEMELPMPRRWGRIAVACIDNADEVRFGVAAAAAELAGEGLSTTLIDLTEHGSLVELAPSATGSPDASTVLRPRGIPTLAGGPGDLRAVGADHDEDLASLAPTDVTLVLADLDPSVGADHLAAWTDRVIIAVTAGRSSAERIRTAADLVRTAGLELRFAALLRRERADESSGTAGFDRPMPIQLMDEHDQPQYAAESADEEWDATNAPTIADQQQPADEDPTTALQQEVPDEQVAADEQVVAEEQIGAEGQTPDEEVIGALQEEISEDRPPDEGQIRGEEQTTAFQEHIADNSSSSTTSSLTNSTSSTTSKHPTNTRWAPKNRPRLRMRRPPKSRQPTKTRSAPSRTRSPTSSLPPKRKQPTKSRCRPPERGPRRQLPTTSSRRRASTRGRPDHRLRRAHRRPTAVRRPRAVLRPTAPRRLPASILRTPGGRRRTDHGSA